MHQQPAHSAHWLPVVITFRGGHCRAKPCIRVLKLRFQLIWVSWRKLEKICPWSCLPSPPGRLHSQSQIGVTLSLELFTRNEQIRRKTINLDSRQENTQEKTINWDFTSTRRRSPRPTGWMLRGNLYSQICLCLVYYLPDEVRARAWTFPENVLWVNCREKERITHFKVRWAVKVTGVPRGIFRQRRLGHNSKLRKAAQVDLFFSVFLPLQSLV